MDAAIDAADAAFVEKTRGPCSYIVSTGQPDAGLCCLLEECKAYDGAKGDFKRPRALYAQIVDITASVADACEKKGSSSDPEILSQLDRISDPEEQSRFYSKHRDEIHRAFEARKNNP